jgi:hypothetical protein
VRALAVVAMVAGCAGAPHVGLEVRNEPTGQVFVLRGCGGSGAGTVVRRILVSELDARKQPVAVVCDVLPDPHWEPTPLTEWRYGSIPPGYHARPCTPLQGGRTYSIHVGGSRQGGAIFTIHPGGAMEVNEGSCK